jgi:branched-chain amino acid transport system substrate-binding protein
VIRAHAVTAIALLVWGCSLGRLDRADCTRNEECRAAFGAFSLCGGDGFCETAAPLPRCDRSFPEDLLATPTHYPDAVLLSTVFDLSLETHRARERSVELAAMQANEVGGLDGRPVGVLFCTIEEDAARDASTRTEAAVSVARHLAIEVGVDAIIGPASSTDTIRAFEAIKETDTVMVSPSATSPALTGIDTVAPSDEQPGLLWRTAPPDSTQGEVIARDVTERGITDLAVVHQTGAYGVELASVLASAYDGDTMLFPFSDEASLVPAVSRAGETVAQEVLFISSQSADVVQFLELAADSTDYDDKTLFLTDAAANADVLSGAAGASALFPRVRGTRPSVPDGFVYDLFIASYDLAFADDVTRFSFTAQSYDAAWLALYGMGWATFNEPDVNGTAIARGFRKVSDGTSFDVRASTLAPILQSFREGVGVNIQGASGALDYDPATEETSSAIDVWTISADGSRIVVERTIAP